MVLLDPMHFPFIAAAVLFSISMVGCGVKTDPVPYLDTVGRQAPPAPAESGKTGPAGKNQAPK